MENIIERLEAVQTEYDKAPEKVPDGAYVSRIVDIVPVDAKRGMCLKWEATVAKGEFAGRPIAIFTDLDGDFKWVTKKAFKLFGFEDVLLIDILNEDSALMKAVFSKKIIVECKTKTLDNGRSFQRASIVGLHEVDDEEEEFVEDNFNAIASEIDGNGIGY